MRFLVRFCGASRMTGVDATPVVIAKGRKRNEAAGLGGRIDFVLADASATPLSDAAFDFVWGEDAGAWPRLVTRVEAFLESLISARGSTVPAPARAGLSP